MNITVPTESPVTTPVVLPIVAMELSLLPQEVTGDVLLNVMVDPRQTDVGPDITGSGNTVAIAVTEHPPAEV